MADGTDNREERIRTRAYAIWEREGRPEGREHHHWDEASRDEGEDAASDAGAGGQTTLGSGASVDRLTPEEATAGTIQGGGAPARAGAEPEGKSRKPL